MQREAVNASVLVYSKVKCSLAGRPITTAQEAVNERTRRSEIEGNVSRNDGPKKVVDQILYVERRMNKAFDTTPEPIPEEHAYTTHEVVGLLQCYHKSSRSGLTADGCREAPD